MIRGIPALLILLLSSNIVLLSSDMAWAQPPEIRAVVSPAPNAARWNNTPVTVTFVCERVATCPHPVTVTEEGTHRVSGSVVDAQGQPVTLGPATVPDGERAAFAFVEELAADGENDKECGPSKVKRYALKLLRVDWDGRSTIRTLRDVTSPGGAARFALHVVVPDGRDAVLVPVRTTLHDGSVDNRIVRVENASERVTQYTLPALGQYVLGADRAFTSDGHCLWIRVELPGSRIGLLTCRQETGSHGRDLR